MEGKTSGSDPVDTSGKEKNWAKAGGKTKNKTSPERGAKSGTAGAERLWHLHVESDTFGEKRGKRVAGRPADRKAQRGPSQRHKIS